MIMNARIMYRMGLVLFSTCIYLEEKIRVMINVVGRVLGTQDLPVRF